MAEAFLQIVVEHLSSLIQGEIGLIMGVDEEMKKLSSTLSTIQAVLEDAETKQLESRAIHNWLVKLNDLAYEIDDISDECAAEVSKSELRNGKASLYSLKNVLFRRKIGRRMKQVAEKLDMIAAERARFHLREMAIERPIEIASTRETGSVLNEFRCVYGREDDRETIVDILVNHVKDNEEISILPIVGVGGLGKTTLAQLVYKDQRVIEHFDQQLWICVSQDFDLKTMVKAMIESANGNGSASDVLHLDTLQRRLRQLLNQKRYLLVLDDVWNDDQEKWSELRNVLACGSTGSSIILTTRLKKVAQVIGTLPTHYLTGLSEEHCWMLLRERAFGQEKGVFSNLEAIGKQIVNKCAGVPLAAKALGGLLRFKRTEKEWIYVRDSEIWELPQAESLILPALKLSYHHLPLALRQCFAYCAVFPKDSCIRKEELIFLWMAHGYISSKGVLEVEDVGDDICNELVLRSLLQYAPSLSETTLIMHDLVHDLAQSIMDNRIPGTKVRGDVTSASNSQIRQVNLRKKFVAFPTSTQYEMDISFILTNFLRLRILDASRTAVKNLPHAVGNLKHLRHLNLSETGIHNLPDSLCSLWNLQVLNLDYCKKLVALPKKMRYLINLRHLFLESCTSMRETPSNIGELCELRTLSLFTVGQKKGYKLEELQSLHLGGKLTILHLERVRNSLDAKKANLAEKRNLCILSLNWGTEDASKLEEDIDEKVLEALEPHLNLETLEIRGFKGRCFPLWMSNSTLEKVVEIEISDCQKCSRLPQLEELPHLKSLRLINVKVEYIIDQDEVHSQNRLSVQFPSLEMLFMWSLPNLKGLLKEQVTTKEAFPKLQSLNIRDCSSLTLPPLSSLKKLDYLNCSSSTLASLSTLQTLAHLFLEIDKNMTRIPIEMLQNLVHLKELGICKAHEHSLPEEGLQALKSLKQLWITNCETPTCLPEQWLRDLNSLVELKIYGCSELVELPDGIKYLNYLQTVGLTNLPKMVSLPKALREISSLQSLEIMNLRELNRLPDWFGDLTSLESLNIQGCTKLASLPASIRGMANLRYLRIEKCPVLERRCEKGKGEDWNKIAHITYLHIGVD